MIMYVPLKKNHVLRYEYQRSTVWIVSPSYRQETKLKVLIKDFKKTTEKTAECPNYRRKFWDTPTANGHQYFIDKNFRVPD